MNANMRDILLTVREKGVSTMTWASAKEAMSALRLGIYVDAKISYGDRVEPLAVSGLRILAAWRYRDRARPLACYGRQ